MVTAIMLVAGCDFGPATSLHDPDRASGPDPVINGVAPADIALAGVDIVTILGQNFSQEPDNNLVYFGQTRGAVQEAYPTQLLVLPPNVPMNDLLLRVAVVGAENFSNGITYSLEPAAVSFGKIQSFEDVFSITTDLAGDVYISLISDGRPVGLERIDSDGMRARFADTGFGWADIAFGPDRHLYAVRSLRAVFRFAEGSSQMTWVVIPDASVKLTAIAVDGSGNVWTAGNNAHIYAIAPDKSTRMHEFAANIRDLALSNDYLYALGDRDDMHKVWRFEVGSDRTLGAAEEVLNVTSHNDSQAFSLAIATSGHVYIGTDAVDPVLVVAPDGTAEPLYPNILTSPASKLAWGPSGYLYMVRDRTESLDPEVTLISTRREGFRFF